MQWTTILHRVAGTLGIHLVVIPLGLGIALVSPAPSGAETISGVCPDGSIFIVQRRSAVPCPDAKQVDPNDIPPLNPELLPRPYGWEQFQGRQDPNNPYNVVDSAPSMQRLDGPRRDGPRDSIARLEPRANRTVPEQPNSPGMAPSRPAETRESITRANPTKGFAASSEAPKPATSSFPEQDLRDLALIVELSQRQSPATFGPLKSANSGGEGLTLRLAYSASFEPRLRAHFQERGGLPPGNVVIFSVVAKDTQPFFGNLTFAQSGSVYRPNRDEPRDLGLLRSEFGMLREGETLLGYARLPEGMDVTREIDIYWNDRLLSTTLKPS